MMEEKKLTNDDLEEQGLVECCIHCNNLHITIEENGDMYCNDCGMVNFTEVITEQEYLEKLKISI